MATVKTAHTCNPEDRREGQTDADCPRCTEIVERRPLGPRYTSCGNCGSADHRDYSCPCGCHKGNPMSQHTPGPWTITRGYDRSGISGPGRDGHTSTIVGEVRHPTGAYMAEGEANARLIAAAPAMLEELRKLNARHTEDNGVCACSSCALLAGLEVR
jgi:hypothetical protein